MTARSWRTSQPPFAANFVPPFSSPCAKALLTCFLLQAYHLQSRAAAALSEPAPLPSSELCCRALHPVMHHHQLLTARVPMGPTWLRRSAQIVTAQIAVTRILVLAISRMRTMSLTCNLPIPLADPPASLLQRMPLKRALLCPPYHSLSVVVFQLSPDHFLCRGTFLIINKL
jgi:hypothetical protein